MLCLKKCFAEFVGTAILVLLGCGSAAFLGCDPSGGHLAVAFAFGLSIVATAYVIGGVSGCHINPAVSFAMLLNKKLTGVEFCGYAVSQILGAILGAGILKYLTVTSTIGDLTGGLGSNGFNTVGMTGAIVVEVVLTFIFVLTILGVTSDEKMSSVAGIVIGLTLTLVHIIGIPLTGTSVNPARSIGPALLAGGKALSELWVFIVAPMVGSLLAFGTFKIFCMNKPLGKK